MRASGDREIGSSGHRLASDTFTLYHPERQRATEERGGVEGPRMSFLHHKAAGSSYGTFAGLRWQCKTGWRLLCAILCEIFDESAYDRFLQRTNAWPSVASYRAFQRERENSMAQKPRCC